MRLVLGILIFFNASLFSAQYVQMDQTSVIPVTLSLKNHNRIGIIGDRVKKAFFKSNTVGVDVEEDSGQLFVQSLKPHCQNVTLSIVSVSGIVQDLELRFFDGPSEIILLQPFSREIEEEVVVDEETQCIPMQEADLKNLVEGVLIGFVPDGYVSFEDKDNGTEVKNGLRMSRVSRLVSDQQIIFIYRLLNTTKRLRKVSECQVNLLDGDWVFLDRDELRPNECALVLIGCRR